MALSTEFISFTLSRNHDKGFWEEYIMHVTEWPSRQYCSTFDESSNSFLLSFPLFIPPLIIRAILYFFISLCLFTPLLFQTSAWGRWRPDWPSTTADDLVGADGGEKVSAKYNHIHYLDLTERAEQNHINLINF